MKHLAVLFISVVLLSACSSTKWVQTPVDKQYDFILTLEQQQEKGAIIQQDYRHPYVLGLAELKQLLAEVVYLKDAGLMNKAEPKPVFQEVEIDRLAPVLAAALAKVDASQRIRFVSFNQVKTLLFSLSQKTEGVIFIDSEGGFNIAFNFINSRRSANETSNFYQYSKIDPLQVKTSDRTIAPAEHYAHLHTFATGKQAPMWLVADPEKMQEAIIRAQSPSVKVKQAVVPTVQAVPATEQPVTPVVAPRSAAIEEKSATKVVPQASATALNQDLKNKLKFLKELQEEGLISKQDYQAKKLELLDEID